MLVMLDLDNTLGDRQRAVETWAAEFVATHGLPPEATAWMLDLDNDGYSRRAHVFSQVKARFEMSQPVETLLADYRRRVVDLTCPTPGATACLKELRRWGHTIVIVTNGSSGQQHAKIDRLRLRPLVDAVIVSGDLGIEKPDAAIFEAASTAGGASLDGAWMVGDSAHHDIGGASALGLSTAWLRRGRTWTETAFAPTVQLDSLTELVGAINVQGYRVQR